MNLTKRVGLLAGAAALVLTGGSFADTTSQETDEQLRARIADLESRLAAVEATKSDNWLTEQRADEIRGLVQDVLADADTRASLLAQGMTAGYDDGFVLSSSDGNFLLRINGQLQVRGVYNNQDGGGLDSLDQGDADDFFDDEVGFAVAEGAVRLNLNAAQTAAVGVLDAARAAAVAADPTNFLLIQGLDDQIRAFLEAAFVGFDSATQNVVVVLLGLLDDAGNPIVTFAGYQSFIQSGARAALAVAIATASRNDQNRSGFENTRTKLWFSGHLVNPQWQYMIEADFAHGGGGLFTLLDAYILYDFENGWTGRVGQFKAPLLHEELVDSRYQLAVERSLFNSVFTAGRVQGIGAEYHGDQYRFEAALSNGSARTNSTALTEDSEWAFTVRGEWLAQGNWDQFTDFTSPNDGERGILVGAAIHFEQEEFGTGFAFSDPPAPNNDELETLAFTVDASAEFGGYNVYGAFVYRSLDTNAVDLNQVGILFQGGYYFNDDWEGFARFEWADFDVPDLVLPGGVSVYSWDDLSVFTFGVNRYFAGHQAKWTTDIGFALDRVEFFAADARAGFRSDTGGDDGQVVLRTQLQLAF